MVISRYYRNHTHDIKVLITNVFVSDMDTVQSGIGINLVTIFRWITTLFSGLIIGFVRGWKLAIVVTTFTPLIAFATGLIMTVHKVFVYFKLTVYRIERNCLDFPTLIIREHFGNCPLSVTSMYVITNFDTLSQNRM